MKPLKLSHIKERTRRHCKYKLTSVLILLGTLVISQLSIASSCQYDATVWNPSLRKTTRTIANNKKRDSLLPTEISHFGCTVCKDDQITLKLNNGLLITLCHKIAVKVQSALNNALYRGAKIDAILGYHPQFSKGPVNERGERSELSNHSFGIAIDINPMQNGLYDQCPNWNPNLCRLKKGGPYQPQIETRSLTDNHAIVLEMRRIGYNWGGSLAGLQKDFMHFSPDGA